MNESDAAWEVKEGEEKRRLKETDWLGIVMGIIVFVLGITLLVITFVSAAAMFAQPARVAIGAAADPDLTQVGISFGGVLLQIGLLLVMSIIGSLISGKGIRMYLAARMLFRPRHEDGDV